MFLIGLILNLISRVLEGQGISFTPNHPDREFPMRIRTFCALLLMALGWAHAQKTNIAVLQFDAANITESEVRILTDRLRTELIGLGTYNVVERSAMEEILQEQGFQQTGCVSDECVIEVGKLVGVRQMIAGSIGKIGTIYTVTARVIDVETSTVLAQKSVDCRCPIETLLTESMAEIAGALTGTLVRVEPRPKPTLDYGSVHFESELDSVRIYSFDRGRIQTLLGYTPLSVENVDVGKYEFSASKEGFIEYKGVYEVFPGSEINIEVELEEMVGSLEITTVQDSVMIMLNGDSVGFAPYSAPELPVGKYALLAYADKYRPLETEVEVLDGKTTHKEIELILKQGQLEVLPVRPGQDFNIVIGDQNFTLTDQLLILLPEGSYDARIEGHGFNDFEKRISIVDGRKTVIEADNSLLLVRADLQVHPPESVVSIKGKTIIGDYEWTSLQRRGGKGPIRVGKTAVGDYDWVDDKIVFTLPFGTYEIKASAHKHAGESLQLEVNQDQAYTVALDLHPKSKGKAVSLSSFIPGSGQIYAENYFRGIVFLAVTAGGAALLTQSFDGYQKEMTLLDKHRKNYRNATGLEDIGRMKRLYESQVTVVNGVQTEVLAYGIVLGATWLANLVDVLLFNGIPDE